MKKLVLGNKEAELPLIQGGYGYRYQPFVAGGCQRNGCVKILQGTCCRCRKSRGGVVICGTNVERIDRIVSVHELMQELCGESP